MATGNRGVLATAGTAEVYELASCGRETDMRGLAAAVAGETTGADRGSHAIFAQYCLTVLELGLGNYQAALQNARGVSDDDAPTLGTHVLANLVEAAARCADTDLAEAALTRLAERLRGMAAPPAPPPARATVRLPPSCSPVPPPSSTTCGRCTGSSA